MDDFDKFKGDVLIWIRSNGFPDIVGSIFLGDKSLSKSHSINWAAMQFWEHRNNLIRPLQEVATYLDGNDRYWMAFSSCLEKATWWCEPGAMEKRSNSKTSKQIKKQIVKKANDIAELIKQLNEVDGGVADFFANNFAYMDLFRLGALIQNEMGKGCDYENGLKADMDQLLLTDEFRFSMPKFENLILAYARRIYFVDDPLDNGFNPIEFSRRYGQSDFIRVFTSELKEYELLGSLPESILKLSFISIETFADMLYPHAATVRATNCIDKKWNPIKDGIDKELKNKRKIS